MNSFFSIIIPTYNRAHLILKAIESVIVQTFTDWELIIVDDGSTDNTKELIAQYQDKDNRVRYIYQENAERSAARNNGIKHAKGEYICFLDSDDYYLKDRLKNIYNFIQGEKKPRNFYYTAITYDFNGRLEERQERMRGKENVFEFIVQAIIGTPQVILSKEILIKERFDPRWHIGEDMELWLRLARFEEPRFIKNQATVVAVEHEERSVNVKKYNSGLDQLDLFKSIFKKEHSGKELNRKLKRRLSSNAYYSIFKYWLFNNNRFKSITSLIKSIVFKPNHEQTKYKVNLIFRLLIGAKFTSLKKLL
jgi:glycosyltransferase involved in cell wall biosynthesis